MTKGLWSAYEIPFLCSIVILTFRPRFTSRATSKQIGIINKITSSKIVVCLIKTASYFTPSFVEGVGVFTRTLRMPAAKRHMVRQNQKPYFSLGILYSLPHNVSVTS